MDKYEILDAQINETLLRWISKETAWASGLDHDEMDFERERASMSMAAIRAFIDMSQEIKNYIVEMQFAELAGEKTEEGEKSEGD